MITAWILYACVVGSLAGAGAFTLEALLRAHGRPTRWIWLAALVLSVGWPLGHRVWDHRSPRPSSTPPSGAPAGTNEKGQPAARAVLPVEALTVEIPPESLLRRLDGPVVGAWALTSGVLLALFLVLVLRTRRLRRRWREGSADGREVLFSEEWGPAVVGFLKPRIVLPRWCADLDEAALRLILDHESEHVRAGDLRLLLSAGLLPVLFPWHVPVWWQLASLRTAIEGDCDLRVLRRNPGRTRSYLELLLDVGTLSSRHRPLAAMLSEPYQTLKRRIRIMTMPVPKNPWIGGALLAGAGTILVALACWAPGPTDAKTGADAPPAGASASTASLDGTAEGGTRVVPVFTPYIVLPELRNREEITAILRRAYPPELEEAGVSGTTEVYYFIDEEGRATDTRVHRSSGHGNLDRAALSVADRLRFTPALNRDRETPVWISMSVRFGSTGQDAAEAAAVAARRAALYAVPVRPDAPETTETGEVAGTATDARFGEPLAGVQVFVDGTGRGTLTDPDGRFVIEGVPVGERDVFAQLPGYGEVKADVTVAAGERATTGFSLEQIAIPVAALVVAGSR